MTRYAAVRLMAAALFAVLVVSGTTASVYALRGALGVATILACVSLGLVSFGVVGVVLLFDSSRRHQLVRALRPLLASDRLLAPIRRSEHDREPRDEQRAEVRRRLDYALEGLRQAVGSEPAAVAVRSVGRAQGGRQRTHPAPEAAGREARSPVRTRPAKAAARGSVPPEPAPGSTRLPVSPRVAQGAPLVRAGLGRHRRSVDVAAVHARLNGLRDDDRRAAHRAGVTRWLIRCVVLLLNPAILTYQLSARTSWFAGVWDGLATRAGLVVALALGVAGSVWTIVVTRREHGTREDPRTSGASHAFRSLIASEQLAVRLAVGISPSDAWRVVAQVNHFPPGSALPAGSVEDALVLVEALRRSARRRQLVPVRSRLAAIVRPVATCLVPAAVIIVLL